MNQQLNIPFPKYHFDMESAKKEMLLADLMKLEKEIEHLKYSNRTHKGNYTKIKKQNANRL